MWLQARTPTGPSGASFLALLCSQNLLLCHSSLSTTRPSSACYGAKILFWGVSRDLRVHSIWLGHYRDSLLVTLAQCTLTGGHPHPVFRSGSSSPGSLCPHTQPPQSKTKLFLFYLLFNEEVVCFKIKCQAGLGLSRPRSIFTSPLGPSWVRSHGRSPPFRDAAPQFPGSPPAVTGCALSPFGCPEVLPGSSASCCLLSRSFGRWTQCLGSSLLLVLRFLLFLRSCVASM